MNDTGEEVINVFYEGNNDLAAILASSIASACTNTAKTLDVFILDTGLNQSTKLLLTSLEKKFSNLKIIFKPVDLARFSGLKGYRDKNYLDCYSRLIIPEVAPDIDKAIYLDSDTLVLSDLKELWETDLDGFELAAPPDLGVAPWVVKHMHTHLGSDANQIYISAGVFIIDCKKWREKGVTQSLLDLALIRKEHILIIIEDLFTIYFKNNFKVLDCKWGFIENDPANANLIPLANVTPECVKEVRSCIGIVHFAGQNKVWSRIESIYTGNTILHFDEFWYYASLTPFYEGLSKRFSNQIKQVSKKRWIKLFGLFPIIKIKEYGQASRYYLFGIIPLASIC